MTCTRHRTFTSTGCTACQDNRRTRTSSAGRTATSTDTTAQNMLTQQIVTATTQAAAASTYCDTTSAPSTPASDPCPPSSF